MILFCPGCGYATFDGESCKNCDYTAIDYFKSPDKMFSLQDLKKNLPYDSGVYGWYFDELPPHVPIPDTAVITGTEPFEKEWWLLYIGQAKDLQSRIANYHVKGNHYAKGTMSSLRMSIGCLLSDKLELMLYSDPESFGDKERELDAWLNEHARVAWFETKTENLDAIEMLAIETYVLPLNYNNQHALKVPLSKLKSKFREIAKTGKNEIEFFKEAYNQFTEDCKRSGIKL